VYKHPAGTFVFRLRGPLFSPMSSQERRYIVIPVCKDSHWILFVLCNVGSKVGQTRKTRQTSQISTGPFVLLKFDSISSPEDCSLPNLMRSFLQHRYVKEAGLKSLAEVPAAFTQSVLAMRLISVPTPQQPNSDDCAAYLLHNMELFCLPAFQAQYDGQWTQAPKLAHWYPHEHIVEKRCFIVQLIKHSAGGNDASDMRQDAVRRYESELTNKGPNTSF
jgi:Ulp1 family protease